MKSITIKSFIVCLCCGLLSCIFSTPCFAQEKQGKQGKFGFGIKDIIAGDALVIGSRYWFSENFSVDGNFGFRYSDPDVGQKEKIFIFGGGINQYLLTGGTFNPFVGIDLTFNIYDPEVGDSTTNIILDGKFGGEYFFTERFSLSGAVSLGLQFGDDTLIGTDGRLGVLYYLN